MGIFFAFKYLQCFSYDLKKMTKNFVFSFLFNKLPDTTRSVATMKPKTLEFSEKSVFLHHSIQTNANLTFPQNIFYTLAKFNLMFSMRIFYNKQLADYNGNSQSRKLFYKVCWPCRTKRQECDRNNGPCCISRPFDVERPIISFFFYLPPPPSFSSSSPSLP